MSKKKKSRISKIEAQAIGDAIFKVIGFRDITGGDTSLGSQMGRVIVDLRTDPQFSSGYFQQAVNVPGDPLHDLIFMRSSKLLKGCPDIFSGGLSMRGELHQALKNLLVAPTRQSR